MEIGEEYWNVKDLQKYKVTHEDSLCFYLCHFEGTSSKVIPMYKSNKCSEIIFVLTYTKALEKNIEDAKRKLASWEDTLEQWKEAKNNMF